MKRFLFPTALASSALLTACGGGGGGGSPAGIVTVKVASSNGNSVIPPDFIAYQDGSGTWQTLSSSTTSGFVYTYQFNVTSTTGKYGVVVFCGLEGYLFHALVSERNSLYVDCGTPTGNLSGQVQNAANTDEIFIYWGTYPLSVNGNGNFNYLLNEGTRDIIAIADSSQNSQLDNPYRVAIYRNVQVSGSTVQNIDFNDATVSDSADNNSFTWNCWSSGTHHVAFLSKGNTLTRNYNYFLPPDPYSLGTTSYQAVIPSTLLQPGDFWVYEWVNSTITYRYFRAQPNNYSCSGNPPNQIPQLSSSSFQDVDVGQPTQRLQISWNAYSSGLSGHQTQVYGLELYSDYGTYYWYMHWTTGWLGNSSSYTYTFPNLSSLTGWQNAWYPSEATQQDRGDWVAYTSNRTTADLLNLYFDGTALDGMEYVTARINNP